MTTNSATLDQLQEQIKRFCDDRDWNQFHNPKDLAISLNLEAAEVLEHFQWKSHEEMAEHVMKAKEDISHELADVLYWVLLLANNTDIDLTRAFSQKMAKNQQKYPVEKARGSHKKYTELA